MAQAKEMLAGLKRFQEGGEVTEEFPDLAQALAVLESDPSKYKSMYQYLLTKGDIANLNDQNLAKEDVAALGLVHAARMSNTEPEAFIENIRPSLQNLPSRQQDVRPSAMLQGSSGGFNTRMPGMNFDMPFVPATLMGRVGAEADIGRDTVRAGLIGGGTYIPNMGVMPNPVMADVGYRTPFAGGTLDVGVNTGVQNPSAKNTNVMANYSRRFAEGGEVTDEFPEEAGVMPGQNPSEAAKRLLYYKKTAAPPMAPSTDQPDGMYQEPTVASETARVFGMKPREDRGSILPIYKSSTGLVAPDWMYDIARNATAADMARRGYAVAPEEGVSMALNFTGAGLGTSAAMKKPTGAGGVDLAMNAYHGSPYVIADKFDLTKAGTGTGAQQYGHGVYFAEARPTAERFKKGAKQKGFDFKTEEEALGIELPTNARSHFMLLAQEMPGNPALDPVKASELILSKNPDARNIAKEKLANLFQTYQEKTQGNLYQVDIPDAQVAKMLDWNKPLSQQSPEVLEVIKKIPAIQTELKLGKTLDDLKGGNAYQAIAAGFNVKQNEAYKLASDFLNQQGIPGIRYNDYYAKDASNFVVFDPSMVQMLMRNDKPVSTLPSGTTAKEDLAKMPKAPKGSKAPKVLPKAERDANLEKFMEGSVAPPVYHATTQDFKTFMLSKAGKNTKHPTSKIGIFSTENPDSTDEFIRNVFNPKKYETGANVMPLHMNIKNPYEMSANNFMMQSVALQRMKKKDAEKAVSDFVQSLKDEGHDGLVIRSNKRGLAKGEEYTSDNWVALDPKQIKSAIGNQGTYDPTNPDITKAKGGEVRKPK